MTDHAAAERAAMPVDAAAVVADIKAEVARRRAAGEYSQALLDRLSAEFAPLEEERPIEEMAHLETVRPLGSSRAIAGRLAVQAKRVVRRTIAWYVRPVTEDQSRFNFAVVRRLYDLETRIRHLEERLAERGDPPG